MMYDLHDLFNGTFNLDQSPSELKPTYKAFPNKTASRKRKYVFTLWIYQIKQKTLCDEGHGFIIIWISWHFITRHRCWPLWHGAERSVIFLNLILAGVLAVFQHGPWFCLLLTSSLIRLKSRSSWTHCQTLYHWHALQTFSILDLGQWFLKWGTTAPSTVV